MESIDLTPLLQLQPLNIALILALLLVVERRKS